MENKLDKNQNDLRKEQSLSLYLENEEKKKSRNKQFLILFLSMALAFYVGISWGKRDATTPRSEISSFLENLKDPKSVFTSDPEANKPKGIDFDIFWEVWAKMDRKFVDKEELEPQKRVYGAIKGMMKSVGDPYSGFMDPEETKDFSIEIEGSFEGIGAELGMKEGILTVIAPIEDTPAAKAGIKAGDKIIKINGETTMDISIDEAVRRIRGEKGTEVTLTVLRNGGDSSAQDIKIIRGKIELESVKYEKKENNIGYIKINTFSEDTDKEFNKAVVTSITDGNRGLIVDVRNNPGGMLSVAIDIISKFVPKAEVVLRGVDRDGEMKDYKAIGGDSLRDTPVVVLINEGSASASEILAGALRDIKKVELVGKKSFGKGSVQEFEYLDDGSTVKITTEKWLTPSGQSIHDQGMTPTIEVEYTKEDFENERDPQLDRALEEIKKKIVVE